MTPSNPTRAPRLFGPLTWVWASVAAVAGVAALVTAAASSAAAHNVGPSVPTPAQTGGLGFLLVVIAFAVALSATVQRHTVPVRRRQRFLAVYVAGTGLLQASAVGAVLDKVPDAAVGDVTTALKVATVLAFLPAVALINRLR